MEQFISFAEFQQARRAKAERFKTLLEAAVIEVYGEDTEVEQRYVGSVSDLSLKTYAIKADGYIVRESHAARLHDIFIKLGWWHIKTNNSHNGKAMQELYRALKEEQEAELA